VLDPVGREVKIDLLVFARGRERASGIALAAKAVKTTRTNRRQQNPG